MKGKYQNLKISESIVMKGKYEKKIIIINTSKNLKNILCYEPSKVVSIKGLINRIGGSIIL